MGSAAATTEGSPLATCMEPALNSFFGTLFDSTQASTASESQVEENVRMCACVRNTTPV